MTNLVLRFLLSRARPTGLLSACSRATRNMSTVTPSQVSSNIITQSVAAGFSASIHGSSDLQCLIRDGAASTTILTMRLREAQFDFLSAETTFPKALKLPPLSNRDRGFVPVPLQEPKTIKPIVEKMVPSITRLEEMIEQNWKPVVEDPRFEKHAPMQAARLIKIRRKKMKKHKRRKLAKRMFFEWAKVRMRREARKAKAFEEELFSRIDLVQTFRADEWVEEFLRKSTTDPETLRPKKEKRPRPTRYVIK